MPDSHDLRAALREALTQATRLRDRAATSVLRQTLAAIDNAEAVDPASLSPTSTEAPRRELTEADIEEIVRREIDERSRAATELAPHNGELAATLRNQNEVLVIVLARAAGSATT